MQAAQPLAARALRAAAAVAVALAALAVASPIGGTFALRGQPPRTHAFLRAQPSAGDPLRVHLDLWMTANASSVPIRRYAVDMTQLLHLIIVSDDFTTFAHVHPKLGADGHFTIEQRFPAAGLYHLYADAEPEGTGQQVFRFDVAAGGPVARPARVLPAASRTATVGPYTVRLGATAVRAGHATPIAVHVRKGAEPAGDLHPYLGVAAHAVFLDARDLSYTHVHPMTAADAAMAAMPGMDANMPMEMKPLPEATTVPADMTLPVTLREPGTYRLWLQFRGGSTLYVAPFTVTAQ